VPTRGLLQNVESSPDYALTFRPELLAEVLPDEFVL
jgi:hypothetical protein